MASLDTVIGSGDVDAIKRKRSTTQQMITVVAKSLTKLLAKNKEDAFNLTRDRKVRIGGEKSKLEKYHEDFVLLHEAYIAHRAEGTDSSAEEQLVEQDDKLYDEITSKIYGILAICEEYEESLGSEQDASSESKSKDMVKVSNNEGVEKAAMTKKKKVFDKALGLLNSTMEQAKAMLSFAAGMSNEQLSNKTIESSHIRALPCWETKNLLLARLNETITAASEYEDVVEAVSGIDQVSSVVNFNEVEKDEEVRKIIATLEIIINAKAISVAPSATSGSVSTVPRTGAPAVTPIKVKLNTPKFSGKSRDFAIYKKEFLDIVVPGRSAAEIGALLREGLNTKEKNLLRNNEMADYTEALEILQNEYGKPELVINDVNVELDKIKPASGEKADQSFVSFVEKIENICRDMETVSRSADLKNGHMINVIAKKLPTKVAEDWAEHKQKEKIGLKSSEEIFKELMEFLKSKKEVTKDLISKQEGNEKSKTHTSYVTGQTFVVQQPKDPPKQGHKNGDRKSVKLDPLCIACKGSKNAQDAKHWTSSCEKWKALKLSERKKLVKCQRHIQAGDGHDVNKCKDGIISKWYNNGQYSTVCGICKDPSHCAELCQQNKAITMHHNISMASFQEEISLPPVLLQASFVESHQNVKLGTLWDLCSTDGYITFAKAEELQLEGRDVNLTIGGVRGQETSIKSKLYNVPVFIKSRRGKAKFVNIECYGLDQIASSVSLPEERSYRQLCEKFGLSMDAMERPTDIDLLISMRHNRHHPRPIKTKGNITLYSGPFGKVFGGTDPELEFDPYILSAVVRARQQGCIYSNTLKAIVSSVTAVSSANIEKQLLDHFEDDSIGVAANPKCGQCQCGQCLLGDKPMSIKMEKLYRQCQDNLVYKPEGNPGDPGPFFETTYQWDVPREELIPNYQAVEATMKRTLKKLEKDPVWQDTYDQQLQTLIDKGVARELEPGELDRWIASGKNHYYTAHQMVIHPHNKTTPIRVVFNSSQKFKGFSLNSSWNLGPDMLANLQSTLLRFRRDIVGAQGDISKMFYQVRVSKDEEMMQLFIWKFHGEDKVRTFAMTRLIMGNKPSTNISIVAVQQTTKLFDFEERLPEACEVLRKELYADNAFVVGQDIAYVQSLIKDVEEVAGAGGFKFKEWMLPKKYSTTDARDVSTYEDVEKALGMYWCLQKDEFFICVDLTDTDIQFMESLKMTEVKPKITLRICLTYHMKPFDPLGLVMPTKMIGNLLFRCTLQALKKAEKGRIPWDEELPEALVGDWVEYFEMLLALKDVRFPRSFKPENVDPSIDPDLITVGDGNPNSL